MRDLNLAVKPGSIYGFLGRNGSGKTTTLRMLAGLIKPQAGELRVLGHDPFTMGAAERQWLGYMSEKAIIPGHSRCAACSSSGASFIPTWDGALADALLAKYDLSPKKRFIARSRPATSGC